MGLAQSIIVVNEYTLKTGADTGSRGATPGKYVLRYMARDRATQTLAQVRRDSIDTFVTRYMARADAVQQLSVTDEIEHEYPRRRRRGNEDTKTQQIQPDEQGLTDSTQSALDFLSQQLQRTRERLDAMDSTQWKEDDTEDVANKEDVKYRFRQAQLLGGVAFTKDNVSMSNEDLQDHARSIQGAFDSGKTVMKTVLSFDHEYLREHNIVDPNMPAPSRGQYRGQIDEMKLRYSVMAGIDRMGRTNYDDLDYVGVIQVDTEHVHAHLVMVDRGNGTVMKDGTQRGKIGKDARSQLRRGMEAYLDEHSYVARYVSDVAYERQNVVSFIKNWAVNTVIKESSAQWIVSHLPDDESQWRAGSNRESMRKANAFVRGMVEDRLDDPESPMHNTMRSIVRYADKRTQKEQLDTDEREQLISRGRKQVVDQAVNGVYGVLASLPRKDRQQISTPMMRVMTMDADELYDAVEKGRNIISGNTVARDGDDAQSGKCTTLTEFGMRLRTYASRRDHHLQQREVYETAMRDWEKAYEDGRASAQSRVMYEHAEQEAAYHGRAGQKYTQVFGGVNNDAQWSREWERVATLGDQCVRLGAMRKDTSLMRMKDETAAEDQGEQIYGVAGAGALTRTGKAGKQARERFDAHLDSLRDDYAQAVDALNRKWSQYGAHIAVVDSAVDTAADSAVDTAVGTASDKDDEAKSDKTTRLRLRQSALPADAGDIARKSVVGDEDINVHTPGAVLDCVVAPEFSASETRGIDMHDMRNEITDNVTVGPKVRQRYAARTAARRRALDRAQAFMEASGQSAQTVQLESTDRDISRAEQTAQSLEETDGVLVSDLAQQVNRMRREKERRREREMETEAQEDSQAPERESAQEKYETDSLEGIGSSFKIDERVRSRVNKEMDLAARRAVDEYVRTQDGNTRTPGE